jgi:GAF domain-containing protein
MTPANERQRLNALWSHELLDTEPESAFDALTALAANLCGVPVAIVSLVDANRQWFKSEYGLDGVATTDREAAFCAHTILQAGVMEVPDARADVRFADNPLVTGKPGIRFYAGVPLVDADGFALGTLCVIDRKPGRLTAAQTEHLTRLAQAVAGLVEMRIRRSTIGTAQRATVKHEKAHVQLEQRSNLLRAFARRAKTAEFPHENAALLKRHRAHIKAVQPELV